MKKFIIKFSSFGIVFFLFNFFIYYLLFSENNQKYTKCDLDYDTYLMSDSHGKSLHNFTESSGIYNFSFDSDSYFDIEKKITFLINNKSVKRLVLSADDHCFSEYREKINNAQKSIYFQSIFNNEDSSVLENIKNKYLQYYLPVFNQNSSSLLKIYLIAKLNKLRGLKKDTIVWTELSQLKKSKESLKRLDTQFKNKTFSHKLFRSFNRILEMANDNNIEIILLKFPVSKSYLEAKRTKKVTTPLTKEFIMNKRLNILDFQNLYLNNDNYFKDPDHLNIRGAEVFSKVLIKSI